MTTIIRRLLITALIITFAVMFALAFRWFTPFAQTGDGTQIVPTSSLIAYTSHQDGHAQVYILDLLSATDGNPATRNVSHSASNDSQPTWSPDGKSIAYVSDRDGNTEICVMDADGANPRCLTNHKTANKKPDKTQPADSSPVWAPDGAHIAYVTTLNGRAQIYIMDSDGSNTINLSNNTNNNDQPAWSPDLKQIAYISNRNGNYALCLMDGSGFNQRCITNNPTTNRRPDPKKPEDTYPAWSPDSKKLAITSTRAQNRNADIYVINADASGDPINLTQNIGSDSEPSWSPDAQHLVFVSNRGGNNQLWEMSADGSNQVPLTQGKGTDGDISPAWQPAPPDPNATPTQTLTPTPQATRTPFGILGVTMTVTAPPTATRLLSPTPGSSPNIGVDLFGNSGIVGQLTTWGIGGTGGTAPYTLDWIGGSLPPGMTFDGTLAQISGTPTTSGTYTFTLSAVDAHGFGGNRDFTVSIFELVPLPDATVGVVYTSPVISGGNPPYTVTLASGALPTGLTVSSGGTISGTPLDLAGTYTFDLQIRDANNIQITQTYTLILHPGVPTQLAFQDPPTTTTAGAIMSAVTVLVEDVAGNVVTGNNDSINLTLSGGVTLFGTHPVNAVSGVATFSTLSIQLVGAGYTMTASDGPITQISTTFDITPAAANHLIVAGFPSPTVAGVLHDVTVTAKDLYGNTDTNYAGTIHFTSNDGNASVVLPTDYTFMSGDNGVHTFTNGIALITVPGPHTITATDTVTATINGTQGGIVVTPAPANYLTVTGYPSPTVAGVSHTFIVTAYDVFNNVATGYTGTVQFSSSDTNASTVLPANYTFTGGDAGVHTFSAKLTTVGSQSITATDTGNPSVTGTQSPIIVNPAGASYFIVEDFPSPTVAGTTENFTVTAYDAFNNVATGYTGIAHFTSSDTNASTVLPANYTFTGGDAGVHTFSAKLTTADTQSITATDTVTATITGTQSGIDITPDATTKLLVAGFPSPTTAGVAHDVIVTAQDQYDNTTPAYLGTITFTSSDGAGVLPTDYTFVSGDSGIHTFTNGVTLITAGTQSITATDTFAPGITGTQFTIVVQPDVAVIIKVTGYPSPTIAGVSHMFTVTAYDQFNNVATGYTGTVHFTSSDTNSLLPADYTFTLGDAGSKAFNATFRTVGLHSITATDTINVLITGFQDLIDVQPAAATHFTVTGYPSPTSAGTVGTITVTALDAYGNTDINYAGTVSFTTPTDPQSVLPGDYTFVVADNGVHTFTNGVTLKTAGTQSITATDTVTASITGSQTGIVVTAAAADHLIAAGYPSPTVAGVAHNVTVTAKDPYGNTDTAYAGTVAITSSDGAAVLPANSTLTLGVHNFSVTLKTVGIQSITATDTVTATITGNQASIQVDPAAATHFTVTGYPSPTAAGTLGTITVTALDAFGNTATTYAGTVHFTTPTDALSVRPGNSTLTLGVGTFSVTLKTVGIQSIVATDTVTASITGSQTGIQIDPAAATHFTVTGYPSPTSAGTVGTITVTALDAYGNTDTNYVGTVSFTTPTDPQSVLPGDYTFVVADNGVHTFTNGVTLKTAGTQSITATDTVTATITGVQTGIVVTHAAADHLIAAGFTSPTVAGAAHNITVTAKDPYGNTDTAYAGTVAITSSDGTAVLPANSTLSLGVHNFSVTLKTVGIQSITATDTVTATITGNQASIQVDPAAATHFTVTGYPSPTAAGTLGTITVTALDAFGNTATTYAGTVHFTTPTDALSVRPGNSTLTLGVGTFSVTLKTVGIQSIVATDTVTASITGSQTGIQIDPAAATHFTVTGYPSPTVAGVAHNITVTALDGFGNTDTAYAGTVAITSSDGAALLPADAPLTLGVGTFSVTLETVTGGAKSITATDTVTVSITGSQAGITVTPAAASVLVVSGYPNPTSINTAGTLTVTAKDPYNNVVTGYTGTVSITSTQPAFVPPAPHTYTVGNAGTFNFSVTFATAGTWDLTASDGAINGSQTGIAVYDITIAPATLPAGKVATVYGTQTITATGGSTATYTYTISVGTLPAGITCTGCGLAGQTTVTLSGTPTTAGTSNFTIKATDGNGLFGSHAYSILVNP